MEKCAVVEVSAGEASSRGIVHSGKCPSGICPSGNCHSGIYPRGMFIGELSSRDTALYVAFGCVFLSCHIQTVWLNGSLFVYDDPGFESCCNHLNLRYRVCFEQGVLWYSGNYRRRFHSETYTWHGTNMQSNDSKDKCSQYGSITCPVLVNG